MACYFVLKHRCVRYHNSKVLGDVAFEYFPVNGASCGDRACLLCQHSAFVCFDTFGNYKCIKRSSLCKFNKELFQLYCLLILTLHYVYVQCFWIYETNISPHLQHETARSKPPRGSLEVSSTLALQPAPNLTNASRLFDSGDFCDVAIVCGSQAWNLYKNILAMQRNTSRARLRSGFLQQLHRSQRSASPCVPLPQS